MANRDDSLVVVELGQAREEVCDNYVLQRRNAIQYAETLLRLAELAGGKGRQVSAVGMLAWCGSFESRVTGLLDDHRNRNRRLSPACLTGWLFWRTGELAEMPEDAGRIVDEVLSPPFIDLD